MFLVHGEYLSGPVEGAAQGPELLCYGLAVRIAPPPDFLVEFIAAEVVAGEVSSGL